MAFVTATLNSAGELVLPQEVRDALNWRPGMEMMIKTSHSGLSVWPVYPKTGKKFSDLVGMLKSDGDPVLTTEELCAPIGHRVDMTSRNRA